MRNDVRGMLAAVDTLWDRLTICYSLFVTSTLLLALSLDQPGWWPFISVVFLLPWLQQAVKVQILIHRVNKRTRGEEP